MAGSRARRREKAEKRAKKEKEFRALAKQRLLPGWKDIKKENLAFETYYKAQDIVKEEEWTSFMTCLRTSLPANFRITSCFGKQAMALRRIIESDEFTNLMVDDVPVDGGDVQEMPKDEVEVKNEPLDTVNGDKLVPTKKKQALTCLPWYPNRFGWQMNVSRVEIRRSEVLQRLHSFLLTESESGYICRQEAVSMIPPLVLDVQPHHRVLDMCAAPGSKTSQIIEMIHNQDLDSNFNVSKLDHGSQFKGTGLIVANDIDNKRCYMLVHQAKKLHSPSCIVTNHDASQMPTFYETISDKSTNFVPIKKKLKFDRVLCDAPCSGDGTIRKNIDVWNKWSVANGNNFHGLQSRIVKRGSELTAKDGLIVYSTCSLNPQENEAVIANLLTMSNGGLELVEVRDKLPGLMIRTGLTSWKIMTKDLKICSNIEEVDEKYRTQIRPQMFPPADVSNLNLKRCIRVLPHHQDTGGFFIAVMKKTVDTLPWEAKEDIEKVQNDDKKVLEVPRDEIDDSENGNGSKSPPRKRQKVKFPKKLGHKEDPFVFFTENEKEWPEIKKFYCINDHFPVEQLMYRCVGGKKRNIYFLTPSAKKLIQDNEDNIKFINAGARLFNLNVDNECHFRLCQEGLQSVFPFIRHESIIDTSFEDMKKLLLQDNVPFEELSEPVRTKVEPLGTGSCILVHQFDVKERIKGSDVDGSDGVDTMITVPICGWKGKFTLRPYIAKNERIHFLRIIGVDTKSSEEEFRTKFEEKQNRKNQRRNPEYKEKEEEILDTNVQNTVDTND